MADIASLGVVVKPTGIVETEKQLDSLTAAGAKAEKQTAKIAPAMDKAAISAGQLKAATRGLPAQFTDIATSLQAGQNPLTVLLQQGGQIKDIFGGTGPALRAVGGYIGGLIGPATLLAAGIGTLAIAWKQGADEAVAFNKAITLTGNRAGVTADQLQLMSVALEGVTATQGQAAEALAEVAGSGKFAADQLELVTQAALDLQVATGQAVGDTVKQFAKLAEDPTRAVAELNKQYNFLTSSTYEQIKALQDQGRFQEAATLAIETFSRVSSERARQVIDDADGITKAWRSVSGAVRGAFDELRNFGRLQGEVGRAQVTISGAQEQLRTISDRLREDASDGVVSPARVASARKRIAELQGIITDARQVLANNPAIKKAEQEAATGRANSLAIALDQEADSFESAEKKLADRKIKVRGEASAAVLEASKIANAKERDELIASIKADEAAILKGIDEQAKKLEKKDRKPRAGAVDPGIGILAQVRQQIALNQESEKSEGSLTASERIRIQVLDKLADSHVKVSATLRAQIEAELAALDASDKALQQAKEVADVNALIDQEAADALRDLEAERRRAAESNEALIADMQFELELIGLTNVERAKAIALRQLEAGATEEQVRAVAGLAEEMERSRDQIALMDDVRANLSDTFQDFITGAASAKDAVKGFFDSLIDSAARAASDQLVQQLLGSFGSNGGGTAGGDWFSAIAGLFGGGRAIGGPVSANRVYEVGERGPEVLQMAGRTFMIPGAQGQVTPMASAQPATQRPLTVNYSVAGSIDRRSADQIAQETGRKLRVATRNGG